VLLETIATADKAPFRSFACFIDDAQNDGVKVVID